jgi:multiple sugar transport system substrate-binding protein
LTGLKKTAILIVLALTVALSGTALAQETVTLEFLHMTWLPAAVEVMNKAIADFEAAHPNVKINQTTVAWGDSVNQTMITLLGGMQLDLVMSNPTRGKIFKEMDVWANLEEFEDRSYFQQFLGGERFAVSRSGNYDSILLEGSTYGLFYRTDLFEEAGLDPNNPPQTWDELVEFALKLTKDTDGDGIIDQWGLGFPASGWLSPHYWGTFMYQNDNDIAYRGENGKWESSIADQSGLEATQFLADLVHKHGVVPKEIVGMDSDQLAVAFAEGDFAMMFNGMWVMGTINDAYPEVYDLYATAHYPVGPAGKKVSYGAPATMHIPKLSKNKEMAWEFMKFLNTGSPTYADLYALAANSLNWNESYMELDFAKDPKVQPFVDSMATARTVPEPGSWDSYQALYVSPTLQDLILGEITPEEAVEYMHARFIETIN